MTQYSIRVYKNSQLAHVFECQDSTDVGRCDQSLGEPLPITLYRSGGNAKLIVAESANIEIPRLWCQIGVTDDDYLRIQNLHSRIPLPIGHDSPIPPESRRTFDGEVLVELGGRLALRIERKKSTLESDGIRLPTNLLTVPLSSRGSTQNSILSFDDRDKVTVATMLELALRVVREAAGSDKFFRVTADAVLKMIQFERVLVFIKGEGEVESKPMSGQPASTLDGWTCVAEAVSSHDVASRFLPPSQTLLKRSVELSKTCVHELNGSSASYDQGSGGQSLMEMHAAIATPILAADASVIGIIYGDRRVALNQIGGKNITDIEATIIELLAGAIAGGIARKNEERRRTALSGFFSPKVAELLDSNPRLMDGQDRQISVLFCDIRGFSAATEKIGPQKALAWINDVLSEISQCVIDRDGVLVDYVGDELFAMWGAPVEQSNHAQLAIDAGRAIMAKIKLLRERWAATLPSEFGAGIGINSGLARTGNVGSRLKFKFGALGTTVNLGSRLQSATKQFGVELLASGDTLAQVNEFSAARRLAQIRVKGIERPVQLYEIPELVSEEWKHLSENYELALCDFESQRFSDSVRRLGELLKQFPKDRPCRKLLSIAVRELDEPTEPFSPIWQLTTK